MNDIANQERIVLGSRALRVARARRLAFALTVFVVAPTLAAIVFFGMVASSQFESVAVVSVESGIDDHKASPKGLHLEHDLRVVRSYVLSRGMLASLTKDHDFVGHFQGEGIDRWSRLAKDAGTKATFEYYLEHVEVTAESESTLGIHVFAFTPERAQQLTQAIVGLVAEHLKKRTKTARDIAMGEANKVVDQARTSLIELDRTQGSDIEFEVARKRLASALHALEVAEGQAAKRSRVMHLIAEPSLPNEASRPRRMWNIATVFFTALAIAGLMLMLGDFVREHAKF